MWRYIFSDRLFAGGRKQAERWEFPYSTWNCGWWDFVQLLWVWEFILYFFTFNFNVCVCLAKARVHFQHSAELLSRLVKVEANYSLQLYPDEGHILREPHSIQHFQRTVVNYLQSCLKHSVLLDPIEDEDEEDEWNQSPFPSSGRTLLGLYAILCITLGRITRHKSTGVGTKHIRSPPTTSGKIDVFLLLYCMFEALFVYKIHLRWCGLECYWFCQTFTKIIKHACRNGCMMWISLHCIFRVLQI